MATIHTPLGDIRCSACDSRKYVITQAQWKTDAGVLAAALVALLLIHGGTMSNKTRKMLSIALAGAVAAVLIDGFVKPNIPGA